MYFSRRVASVLLASVLVGGSLLAPLSHMIYMAADGMFAAGHHPTRTEASGACLHDAHEAHSACPYLALFAVPLTGDLAEPVTFPEKDQTAEPLLNPPSIQRPTTFLKFHSARGPPHNA